MSNSVNYYEKYLKYESKFLILKAELEGGVKCNTIKSKRLCNMEKECLWIDNRHKCFYRKQPLNKT